VTDYDPANIFAKVIRGELPSHKVYEDDDVLVMMDIFPQSPGHTLVIPKAEARNLLDADEPALITGIRWTQRIARAAAAALNPDGIRVAQFNEAPAGQSVFHLHFHVIPVFADVALYGHQAVRADDAELAELAKQIAAKLT
jgi:histidine triad (HIT) family protein